MLDVNAGFGSWLVRAERLFDAMSITADWTTGLTRGLVSGGLKRGGLGLPAPGP